MKVNLNEKTLAIISDLLDGKLVGNPDLIISSVASLADADASQISFLGNKKYISQVALSNAGAVILPEDFNEKLSENGNYIYVKNPSVAFSKIIDLFAPKTIDFLHTTHHTAVIARDVSIPSSAHIGANVVIEEGCQIGENCVISAGSYIGHFTRIGDNCFIHPNVTIRERSILGKNVFIHSGTVIGSDGFGYEPGINGHKKIPQVGIVEIHDDVEIGANCTLDRARFGKTIIGEGTKIDNLVHIAHNVVIGKFCFIVAQVGIAGSTILGDRVIVAGQAGVSGHLHIGDGAFVMGQAGVSKDLAPGESVIGTPAMSKKEFAMQSLAIKKVERLEKIIFELKEKLK